MRLVADFDHTQMNRTVETDGKRLIAAIERRFSGVKELYRRAIDPSTGDDHAVVRVSRSGAGALRDGTGRAGGRDGRDGGTDAHA